MFFNRSKAALHKITVVTGNLSIPDFPQSYQRVNNLASKVIVSSLRNASNTEVAATIPSEGEKQDLACFACEQIKSEWIKQIFPDRTCAGH